MRISLLALSFLLSLLLTLTHSAPTIRPALPPPTHSGCLTASQVTGLLADLARRARRLRLPDSSIKCFQRLGSRFKPTPASADSGSPCYDHDGLKNAIAAAVKPCVFNLLGLSKKKNSAPASNGNQASTYKDPTPEKPTDYGDDCDPNSCNSGCHYCCVTTGIGGGSKCFLTWCGPSYKDNNCKWF